MSVNQTRRRFPGAEHAFAFLIRIPTVRHRHRSFGIFRSFQLLHGHKKARARGDKEPQKPRFYCGVPVMLLINRWCAYNVLWTRQLAVITRAIAAGR